MAATGQQAERLRGSLAREEPKTNRAKVAAGLVNMGQGLAGLDSTKTDLDELATGAAAAGQADFELELIQQDWGTNLRKAVAGDGTPENPGFAYAGQTGINALAQLLADLSEQAALEGGGNRLRLAKGQPGAEAVIPVSQDQGA